MLLCLSRDSVAAGDDVESHDKNFEVDSRKALLLAIAEITQDRYLPLIQGGKATWVVRASRGGRVLAVVAQKWDRWERATLLVEPSIDMSQIGDTLHFQYFAQRDEADVIGDLRSS